MRGQTETEGRRGSFEYTETSEGTATRHTGSVARLRVRRNPVPRRQTVGGESTSKSIRGPERRTGRKD